MMALRAGNEELAKEALAPEAEHDAAGRDLPGPVDEAEGGRRAAQASAPHAERQDRGGEAEEERPHRPEEARRGAEVDPGDDERAPRPERVRDVRPHGGQDRPDRGRGRGRERRSQEEYTGDKLASQFSQLEKTRGRRRGAASRSSARWGSSRPRRPRRRPAPARVEAPAKTAPGTAGATPAEQAELAAALEELEAEHQAEAAQDEPLTAMPRPPASAPATRAERERVGARRLAGSAPRAVHSERSKRCSRGVRHRSVARARVDRRGRRGCGSTVRTRSSPPPGQSSLRTAAGAVREPDRPDAARRGGHRDRGRREPRRDEPMLVRFGDAIGHPAHRRPERAPRLLPGAAGRGRARRPREDADARGRACGATTRSASSPAPRAGRRRRRSSSRQATRCPPTRASCRPIDLGRRGERAHRGESVPSAEGRARRGGRRRAARRPRDDALRRHDHRAAARGARSSSPRQRAPSSAGCRSSSTARATGRRRSRRSSTHSASGSSGRAWRCRALLFVRGIVRGGPELARAAARGGEPRGRGHPRGAARDHDDHARARDAANGQARRDHPQARRRRDARRGDGHLLRQDRARSRRTR